MTEQCSADNLDKKLVVDRFDELVTKNKVADAQQENIPKLTGKGNINKISKNDEFVRSWSCQQTSLGKIHQSISHITNVIKYLIFRTMSHKWIILKIRHSLVFRWRKNLGCFVQIIIYLISS